MANAVVVGSQWGDEGKAKVIDYLTDQSDVIIRFQGGANAGHTVVANGQKFIFHLVPSGIMNPSKMCVVTNGVVFDAEQFLAEVDELKAMGLSVEGRLFVSDLAHLVLPYHKLEDSVSESAKGGSKIGTTGRGIGPAYADKVSRTGIRVGDLADWERFTTLFTIHFERRRRLITEFYKSEFTLDAEEILGRYRAVREKMLPFIADTASRLFEAVRQKKTLLFEGAQGSFLDIDHGTYPFVTSSNTVAGSACTGSGIGPTVIDHVIGIVKAYTTRVGNGSFPTELTDATGELLRKEGGEFGATTGRPRRCGWFDSVLVRKAVQLSGITRLAITKADVLNNLEEIKVCTHYEIDGRKVEQFPTSYALLEKARPVYETMPGWKSDITGCTRFDDLPKQAVDYIRRLQSLCYDIPILIVSVGPDRKQTMELVPLDT
ncbi:MAG: adenylosuccinate synthase [Chitinispirillaceae bacterium]|jgi:adenylosuccinate synthase|nr:adenylosuccinate synthase [Chitinispirillaceae bacterium]